MKKLTVLSIVAASLLLVGCGESATGAEAKAAAKPATEAAAPAAEATKSAATEAKEAAATAVEKTTEAVAEKATAAVEAATGPDGKALFAKCAGCHGADGKTAALGKSAVIAGQAKEDLVTKIKGYKAGTLNVAGMGALMQGQVASYSDADIEAVAGYIAGL